MTTKGLSATIASTSGLRKTIYEIRRVEEAGQNRLRRTNGKPFPFKTSGYYKGEWKDNQKEGYGVQVHEDGSQYEGEFLADKFHGRGTLWQSVKPPGCNKSKQLKTYAGEWQRGKMHGHGQQRDADGNVYTGLFARGKRNGVGKVVLSNGNVYEGEWRDNLYHGAGVLSYHQGDVFEGSFSQGQKEGPGKYYYASTEKVYEGEWLHDTPRCGYIREATRAEKMRYAASTDGNEFPDDRHITQKFKLPECELHDPVRVVNETISSIRTRCGSDQPSVTAQHEQDRTSLADAAPTSKHLAQQIFDSKCAAGTEAVPLAELSEVFHAIGVDVSLEDLGDLAAQLEITMRTALTFTEVSEIAMYLRMVDDESDNKNAT